MCTYFFSISLLHGGESATPQACITEINQVDTPPWQPLATAPIPKPPPPVLTGRALGWERQRTGSLCSKSYFTQEQYAALIRPSLNLDLLV